VDDGHDELTTVVRRQADTLQAWEEAELHLLGQALRERLAALGIAPTHDVGVALMATATLLGEHVPEWGGDVRCTLAEIAVLGLGLLEDDEPV
jgi:hypothetical protein